jgi:hypothetical protein
MPDKNKIVITKNTKYDWVVFDSEPLLIMYYTGNNCTLCSLVSYLYGPFSLDAACINMCINGCVFTC